MSDVSAWLMRMGDLMYAFNMFGVAVFAVTGGLAAARKQMDILAFVMIGIVTGVGGGTMRDLALGISPVFWVADPNYIIASTIAAIATYFLAPLLESRFRALLWGDALGMALFTVSGTQIALDVGASPVIAITMGATTVVVGGLTRDLLCGEVPLILRGEIYASAAILGGVAHVAMTAWGLPLAIAGSIAGLITFAVRVTAFTFNLSLPVHNPHRPPRKR